MEQINLYETVTKEGLILNSEELQRFINQKVKVIISPIEEKDQINERLMKHAGVINDESAREILEAIKDCKNIDYEVWDEVST